MKAATGKVGDDVQAMIQDLGSCLHRARLDALGGRSGQLLGALERTADRRWPAFARLLRMLEIGVRGDDRRLIVGSWSALVALGQCGPAARVGGAEPAALLRAA
jgi:hypothetical protein